jgi:hypothetical protein
METRNYTRTLRFASASGRSYCYITCPFCQAVVKAFIWSLSGGGKKCTCGALHGSLGQSILEEKPKKLKHFTFKEVGDTFVAHRKSLDLVVPDTCGTGEFVTIGNRNPVTAVFIKSPQLDDGTSFKDVFNLSHDADKHMSIIQFNRRLGGYLYSWANY